MSDSAKNDDAQSPDFSGFGSQFVQLVLSFHAAAWQQMGKVVSMVTGKMERDMKMAKHSIDMLGMLEEKTKGNLTEDEEKYLKQALYELRMNFLDEQKKDADKKEDEPEKDDKNDDSDSAPEAPDSESK